MVNDIIIYPLGKKQRPGNTLKQRILLKLYSISFINKIKWINNSLKIRHA